MTDVILTNNLSKVFDQKGTFAAYYAATDYLRARGFSIGSSQRGEPIGVHYGDCYISKWRNMTKAEQNSLHGTITGEGREGPITVTIRAEAPEEVKAAFLADEVAA